MIIASIVLAATTLASDVPADANVHAVDAAGDVAVTVTVGKTHSVVVTGKVDAKLEGDKLVVVAPAHAESRATITVVVDALSAVSTKGSAHVNVAGINGKSFAVDADNGSVVVVAGKTSALSLSAQGTAHVDASALSAQSVDVKLNEASRAEVTSTASITIELQRASRLTVKGKPKNVVKNVGGVAKLTIE